MVRVGIWSLLFLCLFVPNAMAVPEPLPRETEQMEMDTAQTEQLSESLAAVPLVLPAEKRISLNLKEVDIQEVLRSLAKEKGISIVAGDDVRGPVTVSLKEVTVDEALRAVLDAGGYAYVKEDNILRIHPQKHAPKIIATRKGYMARVFPIKYARAAEIKDAVLKVFPDAAVSSPEGSKFVVVEDTPYRLRKISQIVEQLDMRPKQVLVEARIVEIDWSDANTLGNNLTATTSDPNESLLTQGFADTAAASSDPGLYYTVTKGTVTTLVNALQRKSGFHLLASPRVIAVDGKEAEIISGAKLGYYLTRTTTTGTEQTVEFLEVGIKLNFTPHVIGDDHSILMEIHPEVSDGSISSEGLPNKTTTEATTHLVVKDGDVIVIGGLRREKNEEAVSAVPLLGSIPILGIPFRNKSVTKQHKEIIVLIEPEIVNPEGVAERFDEEAKEAHKKFEAYDPSIFW